TGRLKHFPPQERLRGAVDSRTVPSPEPKKPRFAQGRGTPGWAGGGTFVSLRHLGGQFGRESAESSSAGTPCRLRAALLSCTVGCPVVPLWTTQARDSFHGDGAFSTRRRGATAAIALRPNTFSAASASGSFVRPTVPSPRRIRSVRPRVFDQIARM